MYTEELAPQMKSAVMGTNQKREAMHRGLSKVALNTTQQIIDVTSSNLR